MKNILIVSYFTFQEFIKSHVLMSVVSLAVFISFFTVIISKLTYKTIERVVLDVGLGVANIGSIAMAIFLGVSLISNEVENRTLYMVISKGIKRSEFFIGKFLGLAVLLFLSTVLLGGQTLILNLLNGGEFNMLFIWVCFFIFIESLIVLLITIFFSMITNKYLSMFYSLVLYLIGHSLDSSLQSKMAKVSKSLQSFLIKLDYVLPMFYKMNFKDFLLYQPTLDADVLFKSISYGFFYTLALLFLNTLVFNNRDFN